MYMDIVHSVMGLVPFNFITPAICQLSSMKLCCLLMRGLKYVVCGQPMLSLANERSEIMFLFLTNFLILITANIIMLLMRRPMLCCFCA